MVHVRAAIPQDRAALHCMRSAVWPATESADFLAELDERLAGDGFVTWIAVDGGRPVGFAEASRRPFANGCSSSPVAFLEGIWVAPEQRHLRIGRLVRAVEAWALSQGGTELGSDVEVENQLSQACHVGRGFVETERVVYSRKLLAG